jgi:hypothetical protein
VFADIPQEFPAQGGEKPSFHLSHLADLLLVLSKGEESLLCQVSGITLIFPPRRKQSGKDQRDIGKRSLPGFMFLATLYRGFPASAHCLINSDKQFCNHTHILAKYNRNLAPKAADAGDQLAGGGNDHFGGDTSAHV